MPPTGGNRADRACKTGNDDRGVAVGRCADPHLAFGVQAPALETAAAGEGAAVLATDGDRADPAREARDVNRNAATGCRSVAQLAIDVGAPTLHAAGGQEGAGVLASCRDRADPARQARDIDRGGTIRVCAVPELTEFVVTPASDTTTARERTGVAVPCGDRGYPARQAHDINRAAARGHRAIAESAPVVVAPALHPATGRDDAGVVADGDDVGGRRRIGCDRCGREGPRDGRHESNCRPQESVIHGLRLDVDVPAVNARPCRQKTRR